MNSNLEVVFLGTGGSCSYSNGNRSKYGSNTPCIAVKAGEESLIFDAGSGICAFDSLDGFQTENLSIFFSHYHVDHINGLLFFSPLFDAQKKVALYGAENEKSDVYGIIDSFLSEPLHPVGIDAFRAECHFHSLVPEEPIQLPGGVTVRTLRLSHPGGSIGYRVEYDGKVFCYCTDVELSRHQNDTDLLEFTHNADLLVLDSFFYEDKIIPEWGHSSWREAAEWAKRVNAKKLALFHYGYRPFDTDIDVMEEKAKKIFSNTFAPTDRMHVEV